MNPRKKLNQQRLRRKKRIRSRIRGTAAKPRLSIFRSLKYTYAQLIDDVSGKTLVSASSSELKEKNKKMVGAGAVGRTLAVRAEKAGIKSAVVDRGAYRYHGRVKALVEAARSAGLKI